MLFSSQEVDGLRNMIKARGTVPQSGSLAFEELQLLPAHVLRTHAERQEANTRFSRPRIARFDSFDVFSTVR